MMRFYDSATRQTGSRMGNVININTKNLRSFITVKAYCSMTHLKQQKSFGFF